MITLSYYQDTTIRKQGRMTEPEDSRHSRCLAEPVTFRIVDYRRAAVMIIRASARQENRSILQLYERPTINPQTWLAGRDELSGRRKSQTVKMCWCLDQKSRSNLVASDPKRHLVLEPCRLGAVLPCEKHEATSSRRSSRTSYIGSRNVRSVPY